MRIDKSLLTVALAGMLGIASVACQRKEYPSPSTEIAGPATQDERSGAPLRPDPNGQQWRRPGSREALGPHGRLYGPPGPHHPPLGPNHPPIPKRGLVEA